jgi:hypothetical protein
MVEAVRFRFLLKTRGFGFQLSTTTILNIQAAVCPYSHCQSASNHLQRPCNDLAFCNLTRPRPCPTGTGQIALRGTHRSLLTHN